MAQESKNARRLRRTRRERTVAYRLLEMALRQRDQARMIAAALEQELKKYTTDPFADYKDQADEPINSTPSVEAPSVV